MTLRLSVVSEHGIRLGAQSTKVFGVHGGSIGRGTDNEWILPDPERYLSGKHARIDFRAGTYILVDTSSNGTYVNGAQVPLGKYHDYTLRDGDYIRLGEYEFLVSIDKGNDHPPDESAIVAYDGKSPSSAVRKSTADDLGADLDLSQLLEPSDQLNVDSGVRPRNSYGQAIVPERAPPKRPALESEDSGTPWHMMTRPLKVNPPAGSAVLPGAAGPQSAARPTAVGGPFAGAVPPAAAGFAGSAGSAGAAGIVGAPTFAVAPGSVGTPGSVGAAGSVGAPGPTGAAAIAASVHAASAIAAGTAAAAAAARAAAPVLYDGDFDVGLSALCRGAGIDPRNITNEARAAALQLAGQLLRESVLGLMDLNQSRGEFRNRFRISTPQHDNAPESPLNLAGGVDEALIRLLNTVSVRASSVNAIRDAFKETKAQNTASLAAMRAAFEEFLGRVDPKELEERFERAGKRGVFGTQNKGKYWDLYAEMFPGLAHRPADGFPHAYTEAFAKAYEAKIRTLIPPRRSAFGADRSDPAQPGDKAAGD